MAPGARRLARVRLGVDGLILHGAVGRDLGGRDRRCHRRQQQRALRLIVYALALLAIETQSLVGRFAVPRGQAALRWRPNVSDSNVENTSCWD